jgi:hypothetical protein
MELEVIMLSKTSQAQKKRITYFLLYKEVKKNKHPDNRMNFLRKERGWW